MATRRLTETVRVYVWEWPVRVCHWLIAGSIAVLSVTGLYIANPSLVTTGVVTQRSLMGLVKLIHYSTAIVFGLAGGQPRVVDVRRQQLRTVGQVHPGAEEALAGRRARRSATTCSGFRKPPGFVGPQPARRA